MNFTYNKVKELANKAYKALWKYKHDRLDRWILEIYCGNQSPEELIRNQQIDNVKKTLSPPFLNDNQAK